MLYLGDSQERKDHPRACSVEEELFYFNQIAQQHAGDIQSGNGHRLERREPMTRSRHPDPKSGSPQTKIDGFRSDVDPFNPSLLSSAEEGSYRHPERDLLRLRSGGSRASSLDWPGSGAFPDSRTKEVDQITLMDVTNGIRALHELSQHRSRKEGGSRSSDEGDVRLSPEQIEALGLSPSPDVSSSIFARPRAQPQSFSSNVRPVRGSSATDPLDAVAFHTRRNSPSQGLDTMFLPSPSPSHLRFSPSQPTGFVSPRSWWANTPPSSGMPSEPVQNVLSPTAPSDLLSVPQCPLSSLSTAVALSGQDNLEQGPYASMERGVSCLSILSNVTVNSEFSQPPTTFVPQMAMDTSSGTNPLEKKKRRKYRRTKDCDLPKKPKTPYTFFQLSVMEQIWAEVEASNNAGQSRENLSRLVARLTGQRWRAMSAEGRRQFTNLAASDSERYKLECAEYARKNPFYSNSKELAKMCKMRDAARNTDIEEEPDDDAASFLPTHFGMPSGPRMETKDDMSYSQPLHSNFAPSYDLSQPVTPQVLEAFRMQMEASGQLPQWYGPS